MTLVFRRTIAAAILTSLFATPGWAGGLALIETATPDVGLAGAGRGARAQDASTAFFNPAGMSRLERSQLLAGFQTLIVNVEFDPGAATTVPGGDGGNAGDVIPALGSYYVHRLNEDWSLGMSVASFFGLGLEYDDDWAGRYFVLKAELITVGLSPVVAYRVNDWLSVGAGPVFLYASLDQRAAINNVLDGLPDGRIKLEEDDWGFSGQFAVLVEPRPGTRIGLKYQLPTDLEFKDAAKLTGVGPTLRTALDAAGVTRSEVDLEITMPQTVTLSGYHELTEHLAVLASVSWQDHSEFGEQNVSISSSTPRTFTQDRNFKDTWGVAIGAQYRIAPPWLLSVGFGYDSSPVDDEDRTPDAPLDRQFRYGTGLQYEWSEDMTVGVAYEFLDAGDAEIDQRRGPLTGRLVGDYETNHIHFVNVNVIWRF